MDTRDVGAGVEIGLETPDSPPSTILRVAPIATGIAGAAFLVGSGMLGYKFHTQRLAKELKKAKEAVVVVTPLEMMGARRLAGRALLIGTGITLGSAICIGGCIAYYLEVTSVGFTCRNALSWH